MASIEEEEARRRKYEEVLEVKSLRRIISAYLNYPEAAEEDLIRYERSFRKLPPAHKALLSHLPFKYQKLRRCISENSYFIFEMLKAFEPPLDMSQDLDNFEQDLKTVSNNIEETNNYSCGSATTSRRGFHQECGEATSGKEGRIIFGSPKEKKLEFLNEPATEGFSVALECDTRAHKASNNGVKIQDTSYSHAESTYNVTSSPPDWLDPSSQFHVPLVDVDKVRCIIRNIVRDWAAEGRQERDQCYKPILEELEVQFPNRSKESPPACLVPGAGLGRLALEISSLGFATQGNEFSYYMMICSSFILNQTERANEWTIYPWIHSNCNSLSDSDQLRPISIPDIHPASAGITEGFSMCGGDFVEVYNDPSQVGHRALLSCLRTPTVSTLKHAGDEISGP